MPEHAILITCEHAVNHVPEPWRHLFIGREEVLLSHRAYDPGALTIANGLAVATAAPLFAADITRLLVDHNRSPHHRDLWSEFSRPLSTEQKQALLADYYQPYRQAVGRWIQAHHDLGNTVVHLSVHSFTPVLHGQERRVDIGVLYDPRRTVDTCFGRAWRAKLATRLPDLRIRLNSPYRGRNDCHMSGYRKRFKSADYLSIELEINQALVLDDKSWLQQQTQIAESLQANLREAFGNPGDNLGNKLRRSQ